MNPTDFSRNRENGIFFSRAWLEYDREAGRSVVWQRPSFTMFWSSTFRPEVFRSLILS